MPLSDAVPIDTFRSLFSEVRESVIANDVRSYLKNEVVSASTTALYVWDEMVARGKVVNPLETAQFFPQRKEKLYGLVSRRLQRDAFADAWAAEYYNEMSEEAGGNPFCQLQLIRCYPNDIHIADITLSDLRSPTQDQSGVAPRAFKSLHLFPEILERLKSVAEHRNATRLSLVAASPVAHEVFSRYGFVPSSAPSSNYAYTMHRFGHAMVLPLKEGVSV